MPAVILGIVSLVSTGAWIWWDSSSEPEPVKKEMSPITIVIIVAVVIVIIYRVGKKVFN